MSDRGSDNEEEPQGRSYVWRLTKPELEEELQRNHIPFEPNTTENEIRSAPTSRPVTPVRPYAPAVTLEAVR
ncbi:hypothetical protein PV327_004062 [Microctonus hyperodae]|uniref:Uncharacterized protein n=1 Tax=Microctonus hyperodae TaxID=165561 RepID=A0AA39KM41_MICHY|nr:hypothetical protein PV327_004062 [Microctonus hyperodae]